MSLKNNKPSELDYSSAITDSHNEENKALNVVAVNSLVPSRYGKVELTYVSSGPAKGSVNQAKYFSDGIYQETKLITRADITGSAHKTVLNFVNKTPSDLAGKSFVVYDNSGAVNVWYNLDFSNVAPSVSGTYRNIEVNIFSTNNSEQLANKTALALDLDAQFISIQMSNLTMISSASVGVKQNSYDSSTSLLITNTLGTAANTLNNKYFFLNSALNQNLYYVWYNVGGAGVNPLIPGKTGLMVAIPVGASAEVVAQNTKSILEATGKFITNISSNNIVVSNTLIGVTDEAKEVNTSFTILTRKLGQNRELLATINMTYNALGELSAVERI